MTFPLQVVFELKKKEIEKARSQLEEGRERGEFKASANQHYQHIGQSLGKIATDSFNQTQASVTYGSNESNVCLFCFFLPCIDWE